MPKYVICKLPNVSGEIGGIKFEAAYGGGVVSVDLVDDVEADRLASIPGYTAVDEKPVAKKPKVAAAQPENPAAPAAPKAPRAPRASKAKGGDENGDEDQGGDAGSDGGDEQPGEGEGESTSDESTGEGEQPGQ